MCLKKTVHASLGYTSPTQKVRRRVLTCGGLSNPDSRNGGFHTILFLRKADYRVSTLQTGLKK
jgi:hypothetical protein